ncbi:MAG: heme-binding domain-containing protein, partial [Verrucomicrobiota bacterium]|nr:heme-binding domain-containing protein [Verrucomicrobiota bacterium]
RFREADGQLYVTGLRGWQTTARMAGCFQRVRYTGHEGVFLLSLAILSDGMALTFSAPLDPLVAADPDRYQAQSWNYRWTKAYGSSEFKPSSPQQQGRDPVIIDRVDLSEDHHTVNLRCRPHAEVMQMGLVYDLVAASGMPVRGELHHTIHHVPEP